MFFLLQTHKIEAQHNQRNDMKITLSRQEVEKILLDYANKLVEGYGFNEVVGGSYRDIPSSVDLVKTEPKEQE
jgi:type III secretory pathway lipoprotein EscJ